MELCGLVEHPGLNGKVGTLVRYDAAAERWQVQLDSPGLLRIRASKLRRDRIEIIPNGEDSTVCVMRPGWRNIFDTNESAHHALVEYVYAQRSKSFQGKIVVYTKGHPGREYKPPPVTLVPSSAVLWDEEELLATMREVLPASAPVSTALLEWAASSDREFTTSLMAMIQRAHVTQTVFVATRTEKNTARFGLLQTLSRDNMDITKALLGLGTVICAPTEAVAFHKDNLVYLPTTLSLTQAVRKVVDIVHNGTDAPCPICLESPSRWSESTVFMPCECKAPIHLSCLQSLQDKRFKNCPLCRSPLDLSSPHFT